jgi:hypothetical protein
MPVTLVTTPASRPEALRRSPGDPTPRRELPALFEGARETDGALPFQRRSSPPDSHALSSKKMEKMATMPAARRSRLDTA